LTQVANKLTNCIVMYWHG